MGVVKEITFTIKGTWSYSTELEEFTSLLFYQDIDASHIEFDCEPNQVVNDLWRL